MTKQKSRVDEKITAARREAMRRMAGRALTAVRADLAEPGHRDILLGRDGAKWRHGWIPLNPIASAIKAKTYRGGGSSRPGGKSRVEVYAMPSGKGRVKATTPKRSTSSSPFDKLAADLRSGKHGSAAQKNTARLRANPPRSHVEAVRAANEALHSRSVSGFKVGDKVTNSAGQKLTVTGVSDGGVSVRFPSGLQARVSHGSLSPVKSKGVPGVDDRAPGTPAEARRAELLGRGMSSTAMSKTSQADYRARLDKAVKSGDAGTLESRAHNASKFARSEGTANAHVQAAEAHHPAAVAARVQGSEQARQYHTAQAKQHQDAAAALGGPEDDVQQRGRQARLQERATGKYLLQAKAETARRESAGRALHPRNAEMIRNLSDEELQKRVGQPYGGSTQMKNELRAELARRELMRRNTNQMNKNAERDVKSARVRALPSGDGFKGVHSETVAGERVTVRRAPGKSGYLQAEINGHVISTPIGRTNADAVKHLDATRGTVEHAKANSGNYTNGAGEASYGMKLANGDVRNTHPVGAPVMARQPGIEQETRGHVTGHTDNGMLRVQHSDRHGNAVIGTFNPSHTRVLSGQEAAQHDFEHGSATARPGLDPSKTDKNAAAKMRSGAPKPSDRYQVRDRSDSGYDVIDTHGGNKVISTHNGRGTWGGRNAAYSSARGYNDSHEAAQRIGMTFPKPTVKSHGLVGDGATVEKVNTAQNETEARRIANRKPATNVRITQSTHRGEKGHLVSYGETGRGQRVFVPGGRAEAEKVRANLKAGRDPFAK